jgi:DNA repair photolyase
VTVRHFAAPEAVDTRFYEVEAKSILNRVPPASQMPFRWTINPYRGCVHACTYCLSGETPILLADGRPKALAELEVGDAIYGTVAEGGQRRYVGTRVLAKWSTVKSAFKVVLADGTELIASADHRFLSDRGWKHVAAAQGRRPHLSTQDRLIGTGAVARQHAETPDRRDGCFEGELIKTSGDLRVVAIEPFARSMQLYDITTGTGDFIANGVVSHNCFARPTHEYLDFNAGRDFEREIVVKVNAPELLRSELGRRRWEHEHVALGTNTDPYQWVEGRYELMRGIWEALRDARNPCSVLTKSPLLLRDLDLMRELDAVTDFSAALSIPTLDQEAWRASEPRTPNPRARLEAVAELTSSGIRTGVLIAPLMPGINDSPEQVREIVRLATEAGADYITGIALHLRRGVREVFMEWLAEYRPELVTQYEELYRGGAYMAPDERRRLAQMLQGPSLTARQRSKRFMGRDPSAAEVSAFRRGDRFRNGPGAPVPAPEPIQQTLF